MTTLSLRNLLGRAALVALLPLSLTACDDDTTPSDSGSESDTETDDDDSSEADTNVTLTATMPTSMTDTMPTTVTDTTPDTDTATDTETTETATETDPTVADVSSGDIETTGDTEGTTTGDTDGTTTGDTDETTGTTLECAEANLGDGYPIMLADDNTGSGDDIELSCSGDGGGEETVYEYTSAEAGIYLFDTLDSEVDTTLAILDGCGGAELGCNDDVSPLNGVFQSRVTATLAADTDYLVVVDSFDGEVGPYTLNVEYVTDEGFPATICDAYDGDGVELAACEPAQPGMGMLSGASDTLTCTNAFITFDIYEVEVTEGDCINIATDNIDPIAGATGMDAADLVMQVFDANGDISTFDDELDCTDPTFGGDFGCPGADILASSTGTMTVIVGMYGGEDCPDNSPYTMDLAINGAWTDLSGGPAQPDIVGVCG